MFNLTIERLLPATEAAYSNETYFSRADYKDELTARTAFNRYVSETILMHSGTVSVVLKDGINVLAEVNFYTN